MAWDKEGKPTPWSRTATFVTGKLKAEDWRGQWIGANAYSNCAILGFCVTANKADEAKWVQVDLGSTKKIDQVVLHPMFHTASPVGGWIRGYGFPVRFRIDVSDEADFKTFRTLADRAKPTTPIRVSFKFPSRRTKRPATCV